MAVAEAPRRVAVVDVRQVRSDDFLSHRFHCGMALYNLEALSVAGL